MKERWMKEYSVVVDLMYIDCIGGKEEAGN